MIVVTEEDGGRTLNLAGWIGALLTPAEWLAPRAALFPGVERVRFERLRADGSFSHRILTLAPR